MAKKPAAFETERPDYNPFLKPEHIRPTGPTVLQTIGWSRTIDSKYGLQIVVEVKDPAGKTYDLAIKEGSPNHRACALGFGTRDIASWNGSITVERREYRGRDYVAVVSVLSESVPF